MGDLERIATHSEQLKFDALFVVPDPLVFTNRIAINGFAIKEKLPTVHRLKEYAIDGGLISYGPDFVVFFVEQPNTSIKFLKEREPKTYRWNNRRPINS